MSETDALKLKRQRKYNREFQKNEVIRYLVKKEPLAFKEEPLQIDDLFASEAEEAYAAFLYRVKEQKEYDEGFGPSVVVKVGNEETIWKRSRNKWNPFEKIRTIPSVPQGDFTIVWDRNKLNAYYVTERMYYYLDREKHKNKFSSIRAKLYITRVHQKEEQVFLLQFIMERLSDEEQEQQKKLQKQKEDKRVRNFEQKRVNAPQDTVSSEFSVQSQDTPSSSSASSTSYATIVPNTPLIDHSFPLTSLAALLQPGYRGSYPPQPKPYFEVKVPRPLKAQPNGPFQGSNLPTPIVPSPLSSSHTPVARVSNASATMNEVLPPVAPTPIVTLNPLATTVHSHSSHESQTSSPSLSLSSSLSSSPSVSFGNGFDHLTPLEYPTVNFQQLQQQFQYSLQLKQQQQQQQQRHHSRQSSLPVYLKPPVYQPNVALNSSNGDKASLFSLLPTPSRFHSYATSTSTGGFHPVAGVTTNPNLKRRSDGLSSGSGTNSPSSVASTSPPLPPFPLEIEMPMPKRRSLDHETQRVLNALNNQPLFGQSATRPIEFNTASAKFHYAPPPTKGFSFSHLLSLANVPTASAQSQSQQQPLEPLSNSSVLSALELPSTTCQPTSS
jgi:hypothetical protein